MDRSRFVFFLLTLSIFNYVDYVSSLPLERVIGGERAKPGTFKHACVLYEDDEPWCSCGVLNDYFVVTAAHCVTSAVYFNWKIDASAWKVTAGVLDLTSKDAGASSAVAKIHVPNSYNVVNFNNDIAILELETSLDAKKNGLTELRIPRKDSKLYAQYVNTKVNVAGFGWDFVEIKVDNETGLDYNDGKRKNNALNVVSATLFEDEDTCSNQDTVICAKTEWQGKESAKGLIKGDSGTVIEVEGYALAVLSKTQFFDPNRKSQIVKFTRLGHYYDMIDDVVNRRPNDKIKSEVNK